MKKSIVCLSIFLLGIGFTSCKKDYTCSCEVNKKKYIYDYSNQLKSEAEKACDQQNTAAKMADPAGTCSLTKD
jgi:hypothetical protein